MHLNSFISFSLLCSATGKVEFICGQKTLQTYIMTVLEIEQEGILYIKSP